MSHELTLEQRARKLNRRQDDLNSELHRLQLKCDATSVQLGLLLDELRGATANDYYPPQETPESILLAACQALGYSREAICSDARAQPLTYARQAIMRHMRKRGLSCKVVGKAMGRAHTTVLHGVVSIVDTATHNDVVRKMMCKLEALDA
jgi:chromosomal replication initiation ATPase DnaA